MAKFFLKGNRKRAIALASLALSATLSLGLFAACGSSSPSSGDNDEETPAASTDIQTLKNGNFEYFSEMNVTDFGKRRAIINTPTSWTSTTVSPPTDTRSGIIDTSDKGWNYLAKSGRELTSVADAYEHWEDEVVTAYDRVKFLNDFKDEIGDLSSGSAEKKMFNSYNYTIDYEDVENLATDFPNGVSLHEGVKEGESHVLMIHNTEKSDGVLGTASYYTSSTTITLKAGTAAKVTGWVMTDKLYHYYESNPVEVENNAGAYIAVTNTVGGDSSSGQFIIKNINTKSAWQQYTLYIRANTYATTTYRLVLGLGRNTSSDNRLEAVNGYAFFDDFKAETISDAAYIAATDGANLSEDVQAGLNTKAAGRIFDATKLEKAGIANYDRTFAFDLFGHDEFDAVDVTGETVKVALTEETSGSITKTSKVEDNRFDGTTAPERQSIAEATTYAALAKRATKGDANYNGYLNPIFEKDFKDQFPFYQEDGTTVNENTPVIMILSTNGAAYTAKLNSEVFSLDKNENMLISFYVKTSAIRSGTSGAGVAVVDGENKTTISPFDSTTVKTVDIDDDNKDIYKGWVLCYFIIANESDGVKTFSLEFTYGTTSIVGSSESDYADGYAAFAGFEYTRLTTTQADNATTGTYAKSVTLTQSAKDSTKFDSAAASWDIEKELSVPANFRGASADSEKETNILTGLLNAEYKNNYYDNDVDFADLKALAPNASTADEWWNTLFGDARVAGKVATQPLVIYNAGADAPSYGYTSRSLTNTFSANSSTRISMRVMVSKNATAYFYLTDASDLKEVNARITPTTPVATYWYDDNGNIVKGDPTADDYNKKTDILFYLEDNGLYTKANANDGVYYANLYNFKKDGWTDSDLTGEVDTTRMYNLVRKDGTPAFYGKYENGKVAYYAYYDKDTDTCSQVVENLPTEVNGESILRYDYLTQDFSQYESVIKVEGTEENTWVEISFYVRTGTEAKNYVLEIWAGEKGNTENGLPAGAYVFVDNYKVNTSFGNFSAIRNERVNELLENENNRVDKEDEDSNLIGDIAFYYTFTFYDAQTYRRYDKSLDEDSKGNPWIDYAQSAYSEDLVWLRYDATSGEGMLVSELYIDFTTTEVTVAEHVYSNNSSSGSNNNTNEDTESNTNIWLIISSVVLAVALLFAIVAVIVRKVYKKKGKTVKVEKKGVDRKKFAKKKTEAAPAEPEAKPEEATKPEETPYDE